MSNFFYKVEKKELVKLLELTGSAHGKVMSSLIQKIGRTRNDFPLTIHDIADEIGMSYSQVQKALKDLENAKLIKKKYGSITVSPALISFGKTDYVNYKKSEYDMYNNKEKQKKVRKYILNAKPLLVKKTRTLILGHSIKYPTLFDIENKNERINHFYYNDSYSCFWEFLSNSLGDKENRSSYLDRIKLLYDFEIGLCHLFPLEIETDGQDIHKTHRKMSANNIKKILTDHPSIKMIVCNGLEAGKSLEKEINKDPKLKKITTNLDILWLPNTESIRGRGKKNHSAYKEKWEELLHYIQHNLTREYSIESHLEMLKMMEQEDTEKHYFDY